MGRYELQIYDSAGVEKDKYPGIECAGIYPRWTVQRGEFDGHSPRKNVSRPAGEWQSFDVVFRAPRFNKSGEKVANACFERVVHNGQVVHENVEVTGPTRAAHWNTEVAVGPLMLQGDHGPVAYRNLKIERLRDDASSARTTSGNPVFPGWYAIYHRRPLGETDANHRVTCIDRMEFDADGFIKPIQLTFEGVRKPIL